MQQMENTPHGLEEAPKESSTEEDIDMSFVEMTEGKYEKQESLSTPEGLQNMESKLNLDAAQEAGTFAQKNAEMESEILDPENGIPQDGTAELLTELQKLQEESSMALGEITGEQKEAETKTELSDEETQLIESALRFSIPNVEVPTDPTQIDGYVKKFWVANTTQEQMKKGLLLMIQRPEIKQIYIERMKSDMPQYGELFGDTKKYLLSRYEYDGNNIDSMKPDIQAYIKRMLAENYTTMMSSYTHTLWNKETLLKNLGQEELLTDAQKREQESKIRLLEDGDIHDIAQQLEYLRANEKTVQYLEKYKIAYKKLIDNRQDLSRDELKEIPHYEKRLKNLATFNNQ